MVLLRIGSLLDFFDLFGFVAEVDFLAAAPRAEPVGCLLGSPIPLPGAELPTERLHRGGAGQGWGPGSGSPWLRSRPGSDLPMMTFSFKPRM